MITYNSPKFNKIIEEFTQILKENKVNIFDSEEEIPENIIQIFQNHLANKLESSSSFVSSLYLNPFLFAISSAVSPLYNPL